MVQPTPWLADVRNAARITCTASALALVLPLWNETRMIVAIRSTHPDLGWWTIPMLALTYLFSATTPVFCFALYRDEGSLRLSKRLRLLSVAASITLGVILAFGLANWIASLGPYWSTMKAAVWQTGATSILTVARDPRTISKITTLLGAFSDLTIILLLIALSRQVTDQSIADVPASRFLTVVTKVTIIAWGVWLAFLVVGLAVTPYTYSLARYYALQLRRHPPELSHMLVDAIRALLSQTCFFIAVYAVYIGRVRRSSKTG